MTRPKLPRLLRLVGHQVRMNAMLALEYRVAAFVGVLDAVIAPALALLVWLTVHAHSVVPSAGTAAGLPYDRAQLVTYFLVAALCSTATSARGGWQLAEEIKTGALSTHLLRPAPPMVAALSTHVGEKVVKLGLLLPLVGLLAVGFREDLTVPAEPERWLLFGVALLLAAVLNVLLNYLIGTLAFWLRNVVSIGTLEGLLAGRFVPLAFFPPEARVALALQPWRYVLSFPVEIATQGAARADVIPGLAVQCVYVAGVWLVLRRVWRAGLRTYAAAGA